MASDRRSDFDLDFRDGKVSQDLVELCIRTAEVKRDRKWEKTGNIYVELECRSQTGGWRPSGLSVTQAGHWAIAFGPKECQAVLFVPTSVVGEACARFGRPSTNDMEPNPTRGKLIKLHELFSLLRQDNPFNRKA